jgi:hypothetical protein
MSPYLLDGTPALPMPHRTRNSGPPYINFEIYIPKKKRKKEKVRAIITDTATYGWGHHGMGITS